MSEEAVPAHLVTSATTIIREQAESIQKSRDQLQTQMSRIDKLLQEIGSASELRVQCSPKDMQCKASELQAQCRPVYRQSSVNGYPQQDANLLSVTHRTIYTVPLRSTSPPVQRAESPRSTWPMDKAAGDALAHRREQELKMNSVRSDLTQAVAEAQTVRAARADISMLTAARDQLLSDLTHAKVLGLGEEELRAAELQRRKLHNAIQDLKGQVRVFCRIRPLNAREKMQGDSSKLGVLEDDCVESPSAGVFQFDGVFAPGSQEEIFDDCKDLVQSAVDGHNVTIFSYGETGAGKTFTMYGTPGAEGLAGRMSQELFRTIDGLHRDSGETYSVEGSMAEIYNSRLIDLLNKPVNMNGAGRQQSQNSHLRPKLRQSKEGTVEVEDLSHWHVSNTQQLKELIEHGFRQRSVAETAMNANSSRSHLIFTVKLVRTSKSGETLTGKLVFCDLGGSERLKKTEAVGDRKKEAIEINKSLAALCDVIEAVASKRKHVPYRNHTLTRILQDSLGGTAKTLMFVHCSPASSCASETAMSLKFAARAGRIVNSSPLPTYQLDVDAYRNRSPRGSQQLLTPRGSQQLAPECAYLQASEGFYRQAS